MPSTPLAKLAFEAPGPPCGRGRGALRAAANIAGARGDRRHEPDREELFSDPNLEQATITAWGETPSIGGKTEQSSLMHVTCNRDAAE
jgi:hypothetical protein